MCERERGGVAVTVMHGVVVHVRPNQGFKFEYTPHGLVGIPNLAADGFVSTGLAELLERCFHVISRVEIETGTPRGRDRDHLARLIRGQQFTR
jgi:hypothetical protein